MNKKTIIIILILLIIWASVFYLFMKYGEELSEHPCQVCSNRMGKKVICSAMGASTPQVFEPGG